MAWVAPASHRSIASPPTVDAIKWQTWQLQHSKTHNIFSSCKPKIQHFQQLQTKNTTEMHEMKLERNYQYTKHLLRDKAIRVFCLFSYWLTYQRWNVHIVFLSKSLWNKLLRGVKLQSTPWHSINSVWPNIAAYTCSNRPAPTGSATVSYMCSNRPAPTDSATVSYMCGNRPVPTDSATVSYMCGNRPAPTGSATVSYMCGKSLGTCSKPSSQTSHKC